MRPEELKLFELLAGVGPGKTRRRLRGPQDHYFHLTACTGAANHAALIRGVRRQIVHCFEGV